MNLRLAYMTGQYPRATDTFIQREVSTLRELGHRVQTFSVRRPSDKEMVSDAIKAERARTHYLLPASVARLAGTHVRQVFAAPRRYLQALRLAIKLRPPGLKALVWQGAYFAEAALLARQMRSHRLAHLHNHFANSSCSVAVIASVMGGFTYSFTMHGPAEFFEPRYWRIDEKIKRALFVNCISHFCRSQAMVFAPMETWDRLHIVHCGVDASQFQPRQHSGVGKEILFVGRLAAVKGLPVLLRALTSICREHPQARLRIAGDGPDRVALEKLAADLGLSARVEFLGYQSQGQVRQLLSETDVFALASFAEGVPVVLMEAMAAGVPVVATRIAGIAELVEDGISGTLVPPADETSLAAAVNSILRCGEKRTALGKAGRQKVERDYNINYEAHWLERIMQSALAGKTETVRPEVGAISV